MLVFSYVAKKIDHVPIVYLGIGSNSRPEANLKLGIGELRHRFEMLVASSVYQNEAVGFEGDDFLNAVVCVQTMKSPAEVCIELDEIHQLAGRQFDSARFVSRTLDIDLLLYDQLIVHKPPVRVPRSDVLAYSFVLRPLEEIAPGYVHPVTGQTIAWHWAKFDAMSHPLTPNSLIL